MLNIPNNFKPTITMIRFLSFKTEKNNSNDNSQCITLYTYDLKTIRRMVIIYDYNWSSLVFYGLEDINDSTDLVIIESGVSLMVNTDPLQCALPHEAPARCTEATTIRIHHECGNRIEKSVPRITVWHHEACHVMTNGDPEGRFFYPTLTRLMLVIVLLF